MRGLLLAVIAMCIALVACDDNMGAPYQVNPIEMDGGVTCYLVYNAEGVAMSCLRKEP